MTTPLGRIRGLWTMPALMAVLVLGLSTVACGGDSSKNRPNRGTPSLVDIEILGFTAVDQGGGAVLYTVVFENPTATDINTPFDLHLYYDLAAAPTAGDPIDDMTSFTFLDAGISIAVQFLRTGAAVGTYDSWVWVDATDAVVEIDETNNVAGPLAVTVQ